MSRGHNKRILETYKKSARLIEPYRFPEIYYAQEKKEKEIEKPLLMQLQRAVATILDNEYWFIYEEDKKIKIGKYKNGTILSPTIEVTSGSYPKLFFDGTYVYITYVRNGKIQRTKFLPQQLGPIPIEFNLWECGNAIHLSTNYERVLCSDHYSFFNKTVLHSVSYPDDFYMEVVQNVRWQDSMTLVWDDIQVEGPFWNRYYDIFTCNGQFIDSTSTSYYNYIFSKGELYKVRAVLVYTGTENPSYYDLPRKWYGNFSDCLEGMALVGTVGSSALEKISYFVDKGEFVNHEQIIENYQETFDCSFLVSSFSSNKINYDSDQNFWFTSYENIVFDNLQENITHYSANTLLLFPFTKILYTDETTMGLLNNTTYYTFINYYPSVLM